MEILTCSICLGIMDDPVMTKCGRTYCRVCIEFYIANRLARCPECRRRLLLQDIAPNFFAKRLVEQYKQNEAASQATIAAQAAAEKAAAVKAIRPRLQKGDYAKLLLRSYGRPSHNPQQDPSTIFGDQQLVLDDGTIIDLREMQARSNALGMGSVIKIDNVQQCNDIAEAMLQERRLFDSIKSRWRMEALHFSEPQQARIMYLVLGTGAR